MAAKDTEEMNKSELTRRDMLKLTATGSGHSRVGRLTRHGAAGVGSRHQAGRSKLVVHFEGLGCPA